MLKICQMKHALIWSTVFFQSFQFMHLNYFYIGIKSWWQTKVKDPVESCTEKQNNIGL